MKIGYFKPKDGFVGDPIPFYHKGKFHLFYLKRTGKNLWTTEGNLFWAHAETENFLQWKQLPDAIFPGEKGSYDGSGCWTGCVIEKEGLFHIFYTGWNPERKFRQSICHAVSSDLIYWEKDEKNPILLPEIKIYEKNDWRDPYVFWNEKEKKWWMLITAREKGDGYNSGCIALAKSKDLISWRTFPPLWSGRICKTPECSDLFKKGNLWYLIFSDHYSTNYIFSSGLEKFHIPQDINVDGGYFYAGKCFHSEGKEYLVGWIPTLEGKKDEGKKEWGGYLSFPREITKKGKNLYFKLPEFIKESFRKEFKNLFNSKTVDEKKRILLSRKDFSDFIINVEVERIKGSRFGIVLRGEKDYSRGYFVEILNHRVMIKNSPYSISFNSPLFKDLSEKGNNYSIWVICIGENMEVFINDKVVISGKCYNYRKGKIGIYVIDGRVKLKSFKYSEV